jgi:hypothetical protein
MNAWLLTWEGTGSNLTPENKIVAIVSARRSTSCIEDLIEILYCRTADSAYDAPRGANKTRERRRQFRATYSANDRIFYGRNPLIFARRVSKLGVVQNEAQGTETVTWLEPPYLKIDPADYMPVVAERSSICCVVRCLDLPLSRDLRRV